MLTDFFMAILATLIRRAEARRTEKILNRHRHIGFGEYKDILLYNKLKERTLKLLKVAIITTIIISGVFWIWVAWHIGEIKALLMSVQ